ncbi:hypothetical protein VmeM32_00238 [Vibrio phage vB_VmeM-32]|nr:hypothetical protein VmeM32_00238 [Vibrio phage vB_VmeM-32]
MKNKKIDYLYVLATTTVQGQTKIVSQNGETILYKTREQAIKAEKEFVQILLNKCDETIKVGMFKRESKYSESQKREFVQMINTVHVRKLALPLRTTL